MIQTDGKQTIANAEPQRPTASERIRQARVLREAALDRERAERLESSEWEDEHRYDHDEVD